MMKTILLAALCLVLSGCMIVTYDARISDSYQAEVVKAQPISYNINVIGPRDSKESNKAKYSEIVREVFNRNGVPVKEVPSLAEAERQHFEINVSLPTRREYTGQDMITGLTLFVIPTWSTRESYFEYEIKLFENKQMKDTHRVALDETTYMGVIFAPFSWVNFFTFPKRTREFEKTIETVLRKARP